MFTHNTNPQHPSVEFTQVRPWLKLAIAMVVVLLIFSWGTAMAAVTHTTYTWDGGGDGATWFDANNWDQSNTLPGSTQTYFGTANPTPDPNVLNTATIGASTSGTITYDATGQTYKSFSLLNVLTSGATALTLNINGNLSATHNADAVASTGDMQVRDTLGGGGNLTVNVNSGTYAINYYSPIFNSTGTMTIASGATVVAMNGTPTSNRSGATVTGGGTLLVQGTLANDSTTQVNSIRNNYAAVYGSTSTLDINGGTVNADGIVSGYAGSTVGNGGIIKIRGNASVTLRYGGQGFTTGGNGTPYTNTVDVTGGTTTNNTTMQLSTVNQSGATANGSTAMTISGASTTWNQNGSAYIGDGRVATLTISDNATFASPADVFVGSGRTGGDTAPTTAAYSGTLTINSGTMTISNPNAGTQFVANGAGTTTGSAFYFNGPGAAGTWDKTYSGQRIVFDFLKTGGSGLTAGTTYYVTEANPVGLSSIYTLGVAAASGGAFLSGTSYNTGSGTNTYHTLAARLMVGNTMTFTGGTTLDIPGTLNLNGGTLTVDELVANMGNGKSTINFNGGTFVIKNSSIVDTGRQLEVGNGSSTAVLKLSGTTLTGGNSFTNGLKVNNHATLTGAGTITSGTVEIASGGTLSPGNSPGTLTTAAETWDGGGNYLWEINNATGTAGADPGWDLVVINGLLDITATAGTPFTIKVTSLTLGDVPGNAVNFTFDSVHQYLIADSTQAITSYDASLFAVDVSSFANKPTSSWLVYRGDNPLITGGDNTQLYLVLIPEPTTAAMLGLAGLLAWRRRR